MSEEKKEANEEAFVLLSLKEDESKRLAQAITNPSCSKLLDFLSKKEFTTESEAAKALEMPLSTVHYNMKVLIDSGLVITDEFHYSDKGKEVPHYRLANKFIIIAPKQESKESVQSKLGFLKKYLPTTGIILGLAAAMRWLGSALSQGSKDVSLMAARNVAMAPTAAKIASDESTDMVMESAVDGGAQVFSSPMVNESVQRIVEPTVAFTSAHPWTKFALFFVIGAVCAMLLLAVFEQLRKKKQNKSKK